MSSVAPRGPFPLAHAPTAVRRGGFSLVEMAVVLAIVGLLAALFLPLTNTMMDNNRRKDTRAKLEALEAAMTRFVMTNRRLPCPADGALAPTDASYGLEVRAGAIPNQVCDASARGVVPWRTLGLGVSDAMDAWNTLVTYRVWAKTTAGAANAVTTSLAMDGGMDMSICDPAGGDSANGASFVCLRTTVLPVPPATQTTYTYTSPMNWLTANTSVSARGFRICNASPCAVGSVAEQTSKANGNGVAYVLISHGANRVGSYTPNGTLITTASGAGPGALEVINQNNTALRTGTLPTPTDDFYIDADYDENPATYYDDIVLRPTVIQVAIDAGLGPRVPP